MSYILRATEQFMAALRNDLTRSHPFAHERVAFVTVRPVAGHAHTVLIADEYHSVADHNYIDDPRVGARIDQEAIRTALEIALLNKVGVFHVHMHLVPSTRLWFSAVDLDDQRNLIPDFVNVQPEMPHGAIVLSPSSAAGRVWAGKNDVQPVREFNIVGRDLRVITASAHGDTAYVA